MEDLIRVEDLCKIYAYGEAEVPALRGVSISIERGEFVTIMGPSGSGKSTFLNLIGLLDRPTSGAYHLSGKDVSRLSIDERALTRNRTLGFVFQNFNLLARTSAVENVELPMIYRGIPTAQRRRRTLQLLGQVGLSDRAEHDPTRLSGGEQQRVAIARALANEPSIILADEPTGNLDTHTSTEIMNVFRGLNEQGMTILLITHEHDIGAYGKRMITFRDGVIVADERRQAPRVP